MFGGLLLLFSRQWVGLAAFSVLVVLPTLLWNHYIARVVGAFDPVAYLKQYRFVIWLWEDLGPLSWSGRIYRLAHNAARQGLYFFQAYAFVPAMLAVWGALLYCGRSRMRWAVVFAYALSVYLLFLASNFVMPRLMFMTWPVVYFFA